MILGEVNATASRVQSGKKRTMGNREDEDANKGNNRFLRQYGGNLCDGEAMVIGMTQVIDKAGSQPQRT